MCPILYSNKRLKKCTIIGYMNSKPGKCICFEIIMLPSDQAALINSFKTVLIALDSFLNCQLGFGLKSALVFVLNMHD